MQKRAVSHTVYREAFSSMVMCRLRSIVPSSTDLARRAHHHEHEGRGAAVAFALPALRTLLARARRLVAASGAGSARMPPMKMMQMINGQLRRDSLGKPASRRFVRTSRSAERCGQPPPCAARNRGPESNEDASPQAQPDFTQPPQSRGEALRGTAPPPAQIQSA